jgi:acyl-CoA synthetase (AMP-forming)/AMP-acid ligase II
MMRTAFSLRAAAKVSTPASFRYASSLVTKFDTSISDLPLREAVRYTEKNMKWTAKEFQRQAESHANALINLNLVKAGDIIAVWLPDSAEKHVAMIAAAKMGVEVFDIDLSISTVEELRACLTASNCKMIYFDPMDENQNKLEMMRKAIPEFYEYDDSDGQRFHSKHFRNLTYFIHTGFDIECGALNYRRIFLPHPQKNFVSLLAPGLSDDAPLYTYIAKAIGGIQVGPTSTHASALDLKPWSFASNFIRKQYFETP